MTIEEDLTVCTNLCPSDVHTVFCGKAYCYGCWLDLKEEMQEVEYPDDWTPDDEREDYPDDEEDEVSSG